MSKQTTAPEFVVDVRELVSRPGAHKHVVLEAPLPELATPVARVADGTPVHVDVEIESVVEGLLVTGEVATRATLQCARCLCEFSDDLTVGVRELFALDPAGAEEEGYALLRDDRLPLDTMVRDAVVLAFPSAPLHSADCAGLCTVCGADRNLVDCGHGRQAVDPRWAALAGLGAQLDTADPTSQGPPAGPEPHPEEEDDARP
ncbi:MAG TPA: YceD family protein [Actinomycetota bacterium]|nr:YceD family protein [Actinomycetota bacterium]